MEYGYRISVMVGAVFLTLTALVVATAYLLQKWLLKLLTPTGIPSIPAYPGAFPLVGDIPLLAAHVKKHNKFSTLFDQMGRDLGPVGQLRLTLGKT